MKKGLIEKRKKLSTKDLQIKKIEKIKNINDEEVLRIYGESLTAEDIETVVKSSIKHLDLSNMLESSFCESRFREFNFLCSIVLPKNLESIGNYCFYQCKNLEKVNASDCLNLIELGAFSFCECKNLISITLPESLVIIKSYTFSSCEKLEIINLPDAVQTIGYSAFFFCKSLKEIKLPSNLKRVEPALFLNCISLKTLIVSESVEEIEYDALEGCLSLTEIIIADNNKYLYMENGGLYNKRRTVFYRLFLAEADTYVLLDGIEKIKKHSFECSLLRFIIIPKTVIDIESEAFYKCEFLEKIELPSSIQNIYSYAFYQCSSLRVIYMYDNVKHIGEGAFSDCVSLKSLKIRRLGEEKNDSENLIEIPKSITKISKNLFSFCNSIKKVILHDKIKSIEEKAFFRCESLEIINLPNSISYLGNFAFESCKSLREIEIPSSVLAIPFCLFTDCASLEKIKIYEGLRSIESNAFLKCTSLKTITIPESVNRIDKNIFGECKSLEKIVVDRKNKKYRDVDNIFFDKDETVLIRFPPSKHVYCYQIPNTVKAIDDGAFQNCSFITQIKRGGYGVVRGSLKIPSTVKYIGSKAFADCCNLKKIDLDAKIDISLDCFSNCKCLDCLKIPQELQTSRRILMETPKNRIMTTENRFLYCTPYSISKYHSLERSSINGFFNGICYLKSFSSIFSYLSGTYERMSSKFSYISIYDSFYISSWVF